jgi:hypothetical protein
MKEFILMRLAATKIKLVTAREKLIADFNEIEKQLEVLEKRIVDARSVKEMQDALGNTIQFLESCEKKGN